MKEVRSGASSVVYENKVIVTGGRSAYNGDSDTMEVLKLDDKAEEWLSVPPRLPYKICAYKCLVYKDRLFLIGGCDIAEGKVCDSIFEIFLTSPYSSKLVHHLPEPVCFHGAERFGNNIYIVGGSTDVENQRVTSDVVKYDVNTHACVNMPALPFAVGKMATVSWRNNVITLGGDNVGGEALDTMVMYNIESGKSKLLPKMNYKRRGCTAVVSNNTIVVMGGMDENYKHLNTVESFSFDRYCWEELPPIIEPRSYATAVVKCCNFS